MGYATRPEVELALANALTSGNPDLTDGAVLITEIGKKISSTVTDDEIAQYIRWADDNIDGAISSIYRIPLRRVNKGTFKLLADVVPGDTDLMVEDANRFTEGDVIVLQQGAVCDQNLVILQSTCVPATSPAPPPNFVEPPNPRKICLWLPVPSPFDMNLARVNKVGFPDPVPKISAKLAAAYLYDRRFAAQQEGNKSDFGKVLRGQAYQSLNMILAGAIRLLIADANQLVGRRYYNPALDDVMDTRAKSGEKNFLTET